MCDPPYGVRARTHTLGVSKRKEKRKRRGKEEEVAALGDSKALEKVSAHGDSNSSGVGHNIG